MGGRLGIHLAAPPSQADLLLSSAHRVEARAQAWERRLTRFSPTSELTRVNADPEPVVPIGPTFAAVLDWALEAGRLTDGIVDITMLDERLAAECGPAQTVAPAPGLFGGRWALLDLDFRAAPGRLPRGGYLARTPRLRLDVDGVAKGWIADRALDLLDAPGALVDADGDIALRVAPGDTWDIGVADPRSAGADLAILGLRADGVPLRFGVATSGVSIHRWTSGGVARHHLIDPRSRRPAGTDLLQVTVLAADARTAEALAKTAVILGTAAGTAFLDASPALGAILLPAHGTVFALPRTLRWLR
jgi:thiamine biosynthesis lipoprotein